MEALNLENSFTPINSAATNNAALNKSDNELGQTDFIELLVAQVKNQDPTKPMDPSQFMNQLAQFSTVNGIQDLKTSFDSLATRLSSEQSMQAAGLVGRSVLLSGGQGVLPTAGTISGQVNLDQSASEVNLNIFNMSGELVKTLPLGGHGAGGVPFQWDGFADDGSAMPAGHYLVTAEALMAGNQQAIEVLLEKRIDSINLNQGTDGTSSGTVLNLASGESVSLSDIQQIK